MKNLKLLVEVEINFTSLLEQVYLADRSGRNVDMFGLVKQYRQSRDQLLIGPYKETVRHTRF
jgi:hypothetical protein